MSYLSVFVSLPQIDVTCLSVLQTVHLCITTVSVALVFTL